MPTLKRGSKGKEVEALQARLNKLRTKPPLKVDGVFGPITHKAVVTFQKLAKLRPTDGTIGKTTEAALKIGGPLPVMNVIDFAGKDKLVKELQNHNLLLNGFMLALDGATANVDKILDKHLPVASKMVTNNMPHWEKLAKLSSDITAKQKTFKAIRISDPIKAKKLSEDCDALFKNLTDVGDKVGDNVDSLYDTLNVTVKDLDKGVADIRKMMGHLKKHAKKGEKLF